MINFLCAEKASNNNVVFTVILIVALLAMLIFPYFTQRKKNKEYAEMLNGINVGDLVKTAGGIIGRVTKITDKGEIKTVILETGSKTEKSYMEFDMSMIYCVMKSTKVEENDTNKATNEPSEDEAKTEEKVEETVVVNEEEKPKKATAKKTSGKSTAKKTASKK